MTRIHCTSSGCLSTVLGYIKCIKRTCKVGDFKLETSEELTVGLARQFCSVLSSRCQNVQKLLLECGCSDRTEKKRFDLSFFYHRFRFYATIGGFSSKENRVSAAVNHRYHRWKCMSE